MRPGALRSGLLAAVLLALAGCGGRPLPGLGAQEVRQQVDVGSAPWRSLGAVATTAGGRCTGALVGPRVVLTAAHCLLDPRTAQLLHPRAVTFQQERTPEGPARRTAVASYVVAPGFRALPGPRPDPRVAPDSDWAMLELDPAVAPAPADWQLPISALDESPGTELALGGYQADRPSLLVADLACQVVGYRRDRAGREMLRHSCSATSGASGGPLLVRRGPTQWVVAGVGSMAMSTDVGGWAVPSAAIYRVAREAGVRPPSTAKGPTASRPGPSESWWSQGESNP